METRSEVKVWDPLVRIFHWGVVGAFTVAYASGEDWIDVHVAAGYVLGVLVAVRLVWGAVGTRHARFSDFVRRPAVVTAYLGDLVRQRPRRYLGHNPAGGAMIVLMLAALAATTLTGLVLLGVGEHAAGPLAGALAGAGTGWHEPLEEVHEFFADFTLLLVLLHVAGVVVESLVHRENLVRSMITGRKERRAGDPVEGG